MAGLILLAALIALIALFIWLSGLLTWWLPLSPNKKALLRVLVVIGVFPLMVIDEVIGKYQFEALCDTNGIESVDISRAQGKRVMVGYGKVKPVDGMIIPVEEREIAIKDAESGEVLIRYRRYLAFGGWLMRNTPISMGAQHPMLFDGDCNELAERKAVFSRYDIRQVN